MDLKEPLPHQLALELEPTNEANKGAKDKTSNVVAVDFRKPELPQVEDLSTARKKKIRQQIIREAERLGW